LTVSKGVEEVQIDEPVIEPEDPPTEVEEPGQTTTKTLRIGPLGTGGIVEVQLFRLDEGQKTLIFTKTHNIDEEGDELQVTVAGTGTQRYEIVIDGEPKHTAEVIF